MNASPLSSRPIRRRAADIVELLGSMRFAVSLLVFICLASLIGTVVPQNGAASAYIDQFGPFWYEVFDKFAIWHVYNSAWFLLIMGFLVVSTTLCIVRTAPKMIKEARTFRANIRISSLRAFHHRVECVAAGELSRVEPQVRRWLKRQGYAVRERREGDAVLLAAKRGSANRLGYIFAHTAIVVICIGGLLDSELPVRLQIWLGNKQPVFENMLIADVPGSGKLSVNNPSYRANVLIAEGERASNAIVLVGEGALVQPLPFQMALRKFDIEYYSTGMPSRFVSHVQVTDPASGEQFDQTIEVNEPLRYKGVTVYQSSFDDGGSRVSLTGRTLTGARDATFSVDGVVGRTSEITSGEPGTAMTLAITGLRPINVEDMVTGTPQPKALRDHVAAVTGSAAGKNNDNLRNVGPSIEYRLTDAAGQSHDFHNYMLPMTLDGMPVFLLGVRNRPSESFRYLRIPADDAGGMDEFMRLRALLHEPSARAEAARRFARATNPPGMNAEPLRESAQRALETFAQGGLQAVATFLESNVSQEELPRAAQIVVRLLGAALAELRDLGRERAGQPPVARNGEAGEQEAAWTRLAVAALSDLSLYPAPVLFSLTTFDEVKASVFQVSRTPGKNAVYLGCLLLILGVFTMFYVRDRRIWVWLRPSDTGTEVMAAMTSQRRTLDFKQEFERLRAALLASALH